MGKIKQIGAILIGLVLALIFINIISNIPIWNDCYESHLKECEYAHTINQTYSYCSGFIGKPRQEDFEIFCAFHPNEGCSEIPHGCVLRENEYLIGLRIPYTKLEWKSFA